MDGARIGLGCMRLTDERTIHAALDAGVRWFDTARAYGDNERLLARALATHPRGAEARVITKGGMAPGWRPAGRGKSILEDCQASLRALDGRTIDLYLLHAPDPRTPLETSVRALATLLERGLVRAVGVCNVSRRELRAA